MVNRHIKLVVLIFSAITFILAILVGKPIEHVVSKYLEKKSISYKGTHTLYESIGDAQKYIEIEGLTPFDVSLDDPLIDTYHILKIKLNNEGSNINNSLKFNIDISSQFAKIIDIKHRVTAPKNKDLLITDTIPSLTWSIDQVMKWKSNRSLSWQPPQQRVDGSKITNIAGYNIYGSTTKDVGYGLINEKLIRKTSWKIENNRYSFYKMQAVDSYGLKSKLSPAFPRTESLAFESYFDDVAIINPNVIADKNTSCNDCVIYKSLTQAIETEGSEATFLFKMKKADALSLNDITNHNYNKINVLYSEDVLNMQGKASISIPAGFSEDSKVIFYILYKIWPEAEHNIDFNLTRNPDIQVSKEKNISTQVENHENKSRTQIDNKTALTPPTAFSYISNNNIYLLWEHPKDAMYRGIRVFRTKKNNKVTNNIGEEIYDGRGKNDPLKCRKEIVSGESQSNDILNKNYILDNPPPREKPAIIIENSSTNKTASPAPPVLKGMYMTAVINKKDEDLLPYFIDKSATHNDTYTYTLYAYDDKDNYSYPIQVNASLKGFTKIQDCPSSIIIEIK